MNNIADLFSSINSKNIVELESRRELLLSSDSDSDDEENEDMEKLLILLLPYISPYEVEQLLLVCKCFYYSLNKENLWKIRTERRNIMINKRLIKSRDMFFIHKYFDGMFGNDVKEVTMKINQMEVYKNILIGKCNGFLITDFKLVDKYALINFRMNDNLISNDLVCVNIEHLLNNDYSKMEHQKYFHNSFPLFDFICLDKKRLKIINNFDEGKQAVKVILSNDGEKKELLNVKYTNDEIIKVKMLPYKKELMVVANELSSRNYYVHVFNLESSTFSHNLRRTIYLENKGIIENIELSDNVIIYSISNIVNVFHISKNKIINRLKHESFVNCLSINDETEYCTTFLASVSSNYLRIWNYYNGELKYIIKNDSNICNVNFSGIGQYVTTCCLDDTIIRIYDLNDYGSLIKTISLDDDTNPISSIKKLVISNNYFIYSIKCSNILIIGKFRNDNITHTTSFKLKKFFSIPFFHQ